MTRPHRPHRARSVLVAGAARSRRSRCAAPPDDARVGIVAPDRATFPPVSMLLDHRCGSLDCHGARTRNLQIYGCEGLRLGDASPGCRNASGTDTTRRRARRDVPLARRARARGHDRGGAGPRRRTPSCSRSCARRAAPRPTRAARSSRPATIKTSASRHGWRAAAAIGAVDACARALALPVTRDEAARDVRARVLRWLVASRCCVAGMSRSKASPSPIAARRPWRKDALEARRRRLPPERLREGAASPPGRGARVRRGELHRPRRTPRSLRDIGTMQFRLGQPDAAAGSFRRAQKLDPAIAPQPRLRREGSPRGVGAATAARRRAVAGGDFTHRPAPAQSGVDAAAGVRRDRRAETLASVVVKYRERLDALVPSRGAEARGRAAGAGTFRAPTSWPARCATTSRASTRTASSRRAPAIRTTRSTCRSARASAARRPSLPDEAAPAQVRRAGRAGAEPRRRRALPGRSPVQERHVLARGAARRCRRSSRKRRAGRTASAARASGSASRARSTSTSLRASNDVCAQTAGVSTSRLLVHDAGRHRLPVEHARERARSCRGTSRDAVERAHAGRRARPATIDYALNGEPAARRALRLRRERVSGQAASAAGKTLGDVDPREVRGTWVFGDEPLARSGLAPYAFVAGGVARFDTPTTVMVAQQGVAGERAVRAWYVAGPVFGAARRRRALRVLAACRVLDGRRDRRRVRTRSVRRDGVTGNAASVRILTRY